MEAKLGNDPLRFYDAFTVFIPSDLLRCFQSIHMLYVFVRWETTTSICIHSENFITFVFATCFGRCLYHQAKWTGKQDVIWSVHSRLNHFMSLISFCDPWNREKRKWCCFVSSTNMNHYEPRDVLSKRCSENMQQIDRITLTPKCNFNKVALGVLLKICCIVSKHLFLRTPLHGCSWMIVTGVA